MFLLRSLSKPLPIVRMLAYIPFTESVKLVASFNDVSSVSLKIKRNL